MQLSIEPVQHTHSGVIATYSGLGKYAACKRLWYLSEYLGLSPAREPVIGPLPFGSRIHKAVELWLLTEFETPVSAWNFLMKIEYDNASANGWDTAELDQESRLGNRMLDPFPDWLEEQAFWARYEQVSIETAMSESVTITIWVDGVEQQVDILIRGKADMIVRRKADGLHMTLDWKTTQALANSVLVLMAKSPQPRIYGYLAKQAHRDWKFYGSLFILLRKVMQTAQAKPPFYGELEVELTPADMRAYWLRLSGATSDLATVKKALDQGANPDRVAYFTPSRVACGSCPFRAPCDLYNSYPAGGIDMVKDMYVQKDPFARYEGTPEHDIVTH